MAELEIGILERQCLKGRRFPSNGPLEREVNALQEDRNELGVKINWKFTTEDARKAFKYSHNRLNKFKSCSNNLVEEGFKFTN